MLSLILCNVRPAAPSFCVIAGCFQVISFYAEVVFPLYGVVLVVPAAILW